MKLPLWGGAQRTLLLDTFPQANGTVINGKVFEIGPTWTETTGLDTVNTNRYLHAGPISTGYGEAGISNVYARVDYTTPVGADVIVGLALRVSDDSNFFVVGYDPVANFFAIYTMIAGVLTQRAMTPFTVIPGTAYRIEAICNGDIITGTIAGANLLRYQSSFNLTATKFGVHNRFAGDFCDNFLVQTLGS